MDRRNDPDFPAAAAGYPPGGRSWYCEGHPEGVRAPEGAGRETNAENRGAVAAVSLGGIVVFVEKPGESEEGKRKKEEGIENTKKE